jgi:hypothetical protein
LRPSKMMSRISAFKILFASIVNGLMGPKGP